MAFLSNGAYHADSDADDEFERSIMASPTQAGTDSEADTSSEPPSNQHTPTTFGKSGDDGGLPETIITEWEAEDCVQFLTSLNLRQYRDAFLDNAIDGQALVAMTHDNFKEMGITSLGHRLTILKKVYDVKISQDVPVAPDDYVPLTAEPNPQHEMATKEDITKLARSIIKLRDERIIQLESQLSRLADDYRKLRHELLPVFKITRDRSEPLPMRLGSAGPKSVSPTHVTSSIYDGRTIIDPGSLNPSAAAAHASNQLSGAMHQHSPVTSTLPSPTSPMPYHQPLAPRAYGDTNSAIPRYDGLDGPPRSIPTPTPTILDPPKSATSNKANPSASWTSGSNLGPSREQSASVPPQIGRSERTNSHNEADTPSVEIFKSFRVALEDPCFKVLPAALRRYNIQADWRQYALYIVYGDQERCVGLEEKPLAVFKDLDREGKKPMFMLRKLANPVDMNQMPGTAQVGVTRPVGQQNITAMPSTTSIRSLTTSSALPGGVL